MALRRGKSFEDDMDYGEDQLIEWIEDDILDENILNLQEDYEILKIVSS